MPCLAILEPQAQTFPPPPGGTAAVIEASLLAMLAESEHHAVGSFIRRSFQASMRQRGQQAFAAGGAAALAYLTRRVLDAVPGRHEARAAILGRAWAGLPGWRP